MVLPTRCLTWTKSVGLAALAFASLAGAVHADGIDSDNLVRFSAGADEEIESWVSTTPIQSWTVKKIEAGRVSQVKIVRTSTGTYSSDGLASRHVQYPGIKTPKPLNEFSFSSWNDGHWSEVRAYSGNSYVTVSTVNTQRGGVRTHTCISNASFIYC
jgi:hypothetical protein